MVRVRVLFFARAREITQTNEADLDLDLDADDVQWRGSLDDFIGKLEETYRSLAEIRGAYTLAVNQEYIDRGERLVLREASGRPRDFELQQDPLPPREAPQLR